MMMEFTAAQRAAIGLDALDRDTCVVAGPGSGKTTVLIERFRGMVAAGVSPLRILAITFTEKATSQMRERLADAFADDSELLLQIQRAYVSTVHGFCTRLLRENAILAGVDPRFRVLSEQEALALQRRSADDALDAFLAREPGPVRNLLRSLRSPDLGDAVLEIYDTMRAAGLGLEDLRPRAANADARATLDRLGEVCALIDFPAAAEMGARLRERRGQPAGVEDFHILAGFKCNLNKVPKKDRDPVKRLREDLIPAASVLVASEYYARHRETLLGAISRFDALYRARKSDRSALDFSDLEEYSVRLLEENPEARERIRRQFDYILMDEFQDTNGLQAKLLDLLRPPGRFYAVGDINQSIYGFRHADPQVFDAYRRSIESAGKEVAELRDNFRSRPDILRAVSSLVGAAEGIERHEFQPVRKFPRKTAPSVEVIRCFAEDADAGAALEASWVASCAGELHGSLQLAGGPARFGDMAVLVRKADSIAPLANAFDDAGIPYAVTAGKGFFEAREVNDLTHLLRVLANPLDEISLAAVLRSPLVGAPPETLFELKQRGSLSAGLASSEDPALSDFNRELDSWREARHYVSVDRLLMRAMDRAGYELGLDSRERANVERFLTLVREWGERQSLDELVEELERLRESDPREQDSAADDPGDVVRVMTVHAAKGLEFPIVFLPALQAATFKAAAPALLSPELGLGIRWRNPATGHSITDSAYKAIAEEVAAREAKESNRLLYVAMTRAEEHLVLSCAGKLANWAAFLGANWGLALDTADNTPHEARIPAPDGSTFAVRVLGADRPPVAERQLELALNSETVERLPAPKIAWQHDSTASVTSVALFADCPRRYYLARYLGWDGERRRLVLAEPEETEYDQSDPTEFGREVHAILAGGPRDDSAPEAVALAARFEASEIGPRAVKAARSEREFDFLLAVEDMVLRGQIDLWFEESGEQILVDYKTDDVSGEGAPARAGSYALQLQLYALAVERLTGKAPAQALLYFLRPDTAIPVDVSAEAVERAITIVRRFQEAQDSQEFPLREDEHCLRCPFFRGMCPALYQTTSE